MDHGAYLREFGRWVSRCWVGKKLVRAAADEQRTFRVDLGKMETLFLRGISPRNYFSER